MSAGAEIKKIYKAFIDDGGDPKNISKNSEDIVARQIYTLVHSLDLKDDGGRRFTLAEKFGVYGIPFEQRKFSLGERVLIIKALLNGYVSDGGKVDDLKKTDYIYRQIHGLKLVDENGKRMTMEEKFAYLGHPRQPKVSQDTRADAIAVISNFIKAGGNIYMPRKQLPFFRKEYGSYAQSQRPRVSGDLAFQTNMRELGFDYSEMFYQFGKVLELSRFKDENGFVDSYRRDTKMDSFVKTSAYKLGLPIPVFVGLIGNSDLEGCYLDTEYFAFVRTELGKYLKIHKNFVNMSKVNKPLYEKIRHVGRQAFSVDGAEMTTDDVICLLGFDDIENDFGCEGRRSDASEILNKLRPIAAAKGDKLSRSDIPDKDYRKLVRMIASTGATTRAFFKLYGIDYDGKDGQRLAKVWVNGYPYMREMRAERDKILAEHGVSLSGGSKKEDLFDVLIDASVKAFDKYKSKIFNFEMESLTRAQKDIKKKANSAESSKNREF